MPIAPYRQWLCQRLKKRYYDLIVIGSVFRSVTMSRQYKSICMYYGFRTVGCVRTSRGVVLRESTPPR